MFDLSFSEIILIAIVAIIVIGPAQMPKIMYTLGKWMRQLSYTRFALERQFDNFMTREEAKQKPEIAEKPAAETIEQKNEQA
jgi:sec-independent protein translocase protein TatB